MGWGLNGYSSMDFHSFRVFLAAAESGSFSLAGARLFLTQPAVSKRIAALEQALGAQLFDRIGRQVRLTEAGTALLPRARRLLAELEELQRSIAGLADQVAGTLTMGTSHHIGLHRLPPVLKAYARRHPQVRLDLRFLDSESACREVEQGALELAVVTLPPGPMAHLETRPLWDDPLHIAVGLEHPLARDPAPSLETLVAHPAVLPAPNTYTRDILEQALAARGLAPRVGLCTNYLETLKMLAVTGLGWALLPATMLDADLRALHFPDLALARRLAIVTHDRRTLSNAARAMIRCCSERADGKSGEEAKQMAEGRRDGRGQDTRGD
jgi:DNA-binding transcriptional LysR family regulator